MQPETAYGEEDAMLERVAWVPGKVKRTSTRRINERPEQGVQSAIVRRVAIHGIVCAAVTNEGKRSILAGAKAKGAGLIRGFPDLIAMQSPGRVAYLEVKPPGWKPPGPKAMGDAAQHYRAQCDCHDMLRRLGFVAGFVTSQEEAIALLEEAGFRC